MNNTDILPMWSRNHVRRHFDRGGHTRSIIWVYVAARKKRERAFPISACVSELGHAGSNVLMFRQPATAAASRA